MNLSLRNAGVYTWVIAFGAMVLTSLATVEFLHSSYFPPVEVISAADVSILDDTPTDGRLNILYKFRRNRTCAVTQGRWLWKWGERNGAPIPVVVPLDQSSIPFASPGSTISEMIFSYEVPRGLDPGEWFFVYKTMDWCGQLSSVFGPSIRETQPIPVHIR